MFSRYYGSGNCVQQLTTANLTGTVCESTGYSSVLQLKVNQYMVLHTQCIYNILP